jgi:hypothetical protein
MYDKWSTTCIKSMLKLIMLVVPLGSINDVHTLTTCVSEWDWASLQSMISFFCEKSTLLVCHDDMDFWGFGLSRQIK